MNCSKLTDKELKDNYLHERGKYLKVRRKVKEGNTFRVRESAMLQDKVTDLMKEAHKRKLVLPK